MPSSLTPRRTGTNGSLGTDKIGKTGFIENVYANQIAFGKLYREAFKPRLRSLAMRRKLWANTGCGR
uniref:Multifunctional conjugation protein TraI n=1 Tax=Klebsiella pneumoniae TaxID=573 RepID=A0A2P1BN95_KLEPN|nr:Multifunctional conjugation protein TraI [Klebsiella pneumoniae]